MKTKFILLGLLLLAIVFYSVNKLQNNKGPHNGTIQSADNYIIELKTVNSNFYAFLLDQKLKPIKNKGIYCEIKFFLPDNTAIDATLKPFEEDGFIVESNVTVYQSCQVIFNVNGKSVSAKFENENIFVQKKL